MHEFPVVKGVGITAPSTFRRDPAVQLSRTTETEVGRQASIAPQFIVPIARWSGSPSLQSHWGNGDQLVV